MSCLKICEVEEKCTTVLVGLGSLAVLVWTFVAWEHEFSDACRDTYETNHTLLYWYYVITFWLYVAGLSLVGLIAIVFGCMACCQKRMESSGGSMV
jgi:uncharacterized BrkB/YihY/UPF0761 family membrane protein